MFSTIPFGGGLSLALPPVDLATNPASKWANVRDINEFLAISLVCAVGVAGANPVLSLQQAKDNDGLDVLPMGVESIHFKRGLPTFDSETDVYTEDLGVSRINPQATYDTALQIVAERECVFTVLVRPIDLSEGYTHCRLQVNCPGAKVGAVIYTVIGKAYQGRQIIDVVDQA